MTKTQTSKETNQDTAGYENPKPLCKKGKSAAMTSPRGQRYTETNTAKMQMPTNKFKKIDR